MFVLMLKKNSLVFIHLVSFLRRTMHMIEKIIEGGIDFQAEVNRLVAIIMIRETVNFILD